MSDNRRVRLGGLTMILLGVLALPLMRQGFFADSDGALFILLLIPAGLAILIAYRPRKDK